MVGRSRGDNRADGLFGSDIRLTDFDIGRYFDDADRDTGHRDDRAAGPDLPVAR